MERAEVRLREVPVVVLLLLGTCRLGDAPGFEEVPGLPVHFLAPAEHVLLPGDLECQRLLNTFVGSNILDLDTLAALNRDVRVYPQGSFLVGVKDAEVLKRGTEFVQKLP